MTNEKTTTATVEEAIDALADLGVTGSVELGTTYDADAIVGWCRWAAERRQNGQQISTGLIVSKLRKGEPPPRTNRPSSHTAREQKWAELRARFRELVLPFPPGSVAEKHADV